MFADDVDGAFPRRGEVGEGVFGVRKAATEADGKEGWVVVYYLCVGEGGEVRGGTYRENWLVKGSSRAVGSRATGRAVEPRADAPSSLRVLTKPMGRGMIPLMRSL